MSVIEKEKPPDPGGGASAGISQVLMDFENFYAANTQNREKTPEENIGKEKNKPEENQDRTYTDPQRRNQSNSNNTPNIPETNVQSKNTLDNNTPATRSETNEEIYKYTRYDHHFHVYVESTKPGGLVGRMHPMAIGKIIHEDNIAIKNNITDIKNLGRNKVRIEFKDYVSANNVLLSKSLQQRELKAYIPYFMHSRRGVIRHVDTDLSEEELFENIEYSENMKLTQVRRILRKEKKDNNRLVKTQSVILTFTGQQLPQYVYIHSVRCVVEPYIQNVLQCYKCFRYGHLSKQCRSTSDRCKACGGNHTRDECTAEKPQCIHCQEEHEANYRKCPEMEKQIRIKKTMAYMNISYRDAQDSINNNSFANVTRFETLQADNISEFPSLGNNLTANRRGLSILPPTPRKNYTMPAIKRARNEEPRRTFPSIDTRYEPKSQVGGLIQKNPYTPQYHQKTPENPQNEEHIAKICELVCAIVIELKKNKNDLMTPEDINKLCRIKYKQNIVQTQSHI